MNKNEKTIIGLIKQNAFLSEELKNRYILALFLMNDEEQAEYAEIMKTFNGRCGELEQGLFVLPANEAQRVLRTVDEVKKDLIEKIKSDQH